MIERLRNVDTPAVDKTGTLTEGGPASRRIVAAPGFDEQEVLHLAASLDQASEHPLADTIVAEARARGLRLDQAEDFESGSGIGVRGRVGGRSLALGNTALMVQAGMATEGMKAQAEALRGDGASVMHLSVDGRLAGLLAVAGPD